MKINSLTYPDFRFLTIQLKTYSEYLKIVIYCKNNKEKEIFERLINEITDIKGEYYNYYTIFSNNNVSIKICLCVDIQPGYRANVVIISDEYSVANVCESFLPLANTLPLEWVMYYNNQDIKENSSFMERHQRQQEQKRGNNYENKEYNFRRFH